MKGIDKSTRLLNFLVDSLVIMMVTIVITYVMIFNVPELTFYLVYLLYYIVFESMNGRTLGKIVSKTIVVKRNGEKPSVFRIIFRTLLRFFPLDNLSYLFGFEQGIHDHLSGTRLKRKEEKY